MESASFDSYWVEVRQVGLPATARRVFEWTGATHDAERGQSRGRSSSRARAGAWCRPTSPTSPAENVEVRSSTWTTDDLVSFAGVAIDDVSVTACAAVSARPSATPGVTKTDGQTTYFPGEVLTYTIVASNAGPSDGRRDRHGHFPAELTGVSWTCAASAGSDLRHRQRHRRHQRDVDILTPANGHLHGHRHRLRERDRPPLTGTDPGARAGWTDPDAPTTARPTPTSSSPPRRRSPGRRRRRQRRVPARRDGRRGADLEEHRRRGGHPDGHAQQLHRARRRHLHHPRRHRRLRHDRRRRPPRAAPRPATATA